MKVTYRFLIILSFFALIISCKKSFDSTSFTQEEIGRYIAARVPAVIEPEDPVRIRFSVPVDTTHTDAILSFNPDTKGNSYWEDELTLAFAPEGRWQPGKDYQVQVNLDKAIKEVDPGMKRVVFDFAVRPVKMTVSFEPLVPEFEGDVPNYLLRGRVITSINVDSQTIEKLLVIKTSGKMSPIVWQHSPEGRTHEYVIAEIAPDATLDFNWDGKSIGSTTTGTRSIHIPKGDELSVLSFEPGGDGERKIGIYFSQKLNPSQDLNGLVTINGSNDGFTMRKQDHILSIYPGENLTGQLSVQLHEKISSSRGHELGKTQTLDISLDDAKPGVKLVGSGVITPGNAEIIFPFEAINLKSVQVEVVRVFENNILQFLQRNSLEDRWDLELVGRIILQKEVDLQQLSDRENKFIWTRYALDLGPLVKLAPGSIYQVRIGFKSSDTYLDCKEVEFNPNNIKRAYGEVASLFEYHFSYDGFDWEQTCLLYTSPSPRDRTRSRMPSSA